jgi:biopolymer transport protein ExbD
MALMRKKNRSQGEIPTSSMADIAFLLLVFFLITTVFDEEKGLQVVLPEPAEEVEVSQRNIMHFWIQENGAVHIKRGESEAIQVVQPRDVGLNWRQGYAQNENLIASVRTAPNAPYRFMVAVLDQLQGAGATRISLQLLE